MPNTAAALALSENQKLELDTLVRNGNTQQKVALRCRLLLLANEGVANQSIAQQLKLSRPTILSLRAAFAISITDTIVMQGGASGSTSIYLGWRDQVWVYLNRKLS